MRLVVRHIPISVLECVWGGAGKYILKVITYDSIHLVSLFSVLTKVTDIGYLAQCQAQIKHLSVS